MESISGETPWDGLALSSLEASGRANFSWSSSSSFFSDPGSSNTTHVGGSFFGIFSENASATTPHHTLPAPRVRDLGLARMEVTVLALVLALTTLGNSFVLWVLLRRRKHNAPMHLFMVNLCVADLVVALCQVLPQLVWDITEKFQGPDVLCRSVKYFQVVAMFASSYMIVAMTVDRHYAICCPLQAYRGGAVSRWNTPVMVAWGLALVLSIPQVFIFSRTEVAPGEFECWGHFTEPWGLKAYVTWMTVAVFILPALIITVCQIRIFREIHKNIYLKSERVVTAELKRNRVFFHFQRFKKEEERGRERGRQGSSGGPAREARAGQFVKPSASYGNSHGGEGGERYDYAPPAAQYSGCLLEHAKTTTTSTEHHSYVSLENHRRSPDKALSAPARSCSRGPGSSPRCSLDCAPPPSGPPPPPSITKAMSKTVRMTLVIVLVYTVCWSPYFIVQLWAAWDPNPPDTGVAFTILMLLASLNSCTNPWIYTAFSSSVSMELQSLLRCRPRPGRRGSLPDDSTTTHTSFTKDSLY